jgi:hypothetical protein
MAASAASAAGKLTRIRIDQRWSVMIMLYYGL